jgi:hypothetical protein
MLTNKILSYLIAATAIIVLPIQAVTTFVLGILVSLSFGLLLVPLSLIWLVVFFAPLMVLSYIHEKVYLLRPLTSLIGLPLAFIGNTYTALIPSMGEVGSRYSKMIICQSYPYTWSSYHFLVGKTNLEQGSELDQVLHEVTTAKPLRLYLEKLVIERMNKKV